MRTLLAVSIVATSLMYAQDAPRPYNDPPPAPASSLPAKITVKQGTFVTVRVNQWLSSDRNQTGDTFYATLAEPIVVDGVVVARRGTTVMGRVSEAKKAGRIEGTSSLGLQLTSITLADGNQTSIQSQVISRKGTTSVGRDAAGVGTVTVAGAAVGAAASGGEGAAIGAGAGVFVGAIGVLVTRGRPTEVYPETLLTFQLETPLEINTETAPMAFRIAGQEDYAPTPNQAPQSMPRGPYATGPVLRGPVYPPYAGPVWGPIWGPSVGIVFGRFGRW